MSAPTERYESVGWVVLYSSGLFSSQGTEEQIRRTATQSGGEAVELFRRVSVPERPRVQVPGTDVFVEYRDGAFWCRRWSLELGTRFEDVGSVITGSGWRFRDEDIRALFDLPEQSRAWDAHGGAV